jgi:hypothetical protein
MTYAANQTVLAVDCAKSWREFWQFNSWFSLDNLRDVQARIERVAVETREASNRLAKASRRCEAIAVPVTGGISSN